MLRARWVSLAIIVPLLVGCGETFCQRAERTNLELSKKASRGGCQAPPVPFDTNNCDNELLQCSGDDVRRMTDAMDCLDRVQCEPFKEADFESNVRACLGPLDEVSFDCGIVRRL